MRRRRAEAAPVKLPLVARPPPAPQRPVPQRLPANTAPPPIQPAPTSIAAFVSAARTGPQDQAVMVQSWAQYQQAFGGLDGGELGYAVQAFFLNGGVQAYVVRLSAALPGDPQLHTGVFALDHVALFNLLALPDLRGLDGGAHAAIAASAAPYAQRRGAMLILDPPKAVAAGAAAGAQAWAQAAVSALGVGAINVAAYWPEPMVADQLNNGAARPIAASGPVAGVFVATDQARGVWKSPAGVGAALNGVTGLRTMLTDAQSGALGALNPLRRFAAGGPVVWGARTMAPQGTEWTYVPVRRLALYIEESLSGGLGWTVFEPNAQPLWSKLTLTVSAFMQSVFRLGALAGTTPQQAYFVKCDATTTTQANIAAGIVNIVVGFAPLQPAEFVVLTIQQLAGA
jgi:hypothetical protein